MLADIPVAAIKIGLLASLGAVDALHDVLADFETIPVVLDPVGRAGGGAPLADDDLMRAVAARLLPRTTVATPNTREAFRLAPGAATVGAAARRLLESGCGHVLVTGADEATPGVVNRLYESGGRVESFEWPRVDGVFHGSGCTLAASLAAGLARGLAPRAAAAEAQRYTRDAIAGGYRIGGGQLVPERLLRARGHGVALRRAENR